MSLPMLVPFSLVVLLLSAAPGSQAASPKIVDLSLLISPEMPCNWPAGWPLFVISPHQRIGRLSAVNSDTLFIDVNCGTQMDVPPHSVQL